MLKSTILKMLPCFLIFAFLLSGVTIAQTVILYKDKDYKGNELKLTADAANLNGSPYYFGAEASSVKLQGIMSIAVYDEINYGGKCMTITGSISNLKDTNIGNDKILSVKLNSRCPAITVPAVELFEEIHWAGKSVIITADNPNLKKVDFNDKASSIKLYNLSQAALYEHTDYKGECMTITKSDSVLGESGEIKNNTVSSVKLNTKCEDNASLLIKNSSAKVARYKVTDQKTGEVYEKKILAGQSGNMLFPKNRKVKVSVEAWEISWIEDCSFDLEMTENIEVSYKGAAFTFGAFDHCDVKHIY